MKDKKEQEQRVRWQDGTYNPYTDHYREIITKQTYWDWMEQNAPSGHDEDGNVLELPSANPDVVAASDESLGPVGTEEQYDLMQQAFVQLSPKQQEVWELCMRRALSEKEAADQLGIKQQSVHDRLISAKGIITNFLRDKGYGD